SKSKLEIDEAYAILGLQTGASKEEVVKAHRSMIQKVHPDRGGSDYLAAQINEAKDRIINYLA
ncbi:MAG: curved DNA-binding protein CbpA, partial [Gammaproteobacteria bacterium]